MRKAIVIFISYKLTLAQCTDVAYVSDKSLEIKTDFPVALILSSDYFISVFNICE